MDRRTSLLAIPAFIAGCATTRNVSDEHVLRPDEGLLVVEVFCDRPGALAFRRYGDDSPGARLSDDLTGPQNVLGLQPRQQFIVRALAAGDYMWTRLSAYQRSARLGTSTRFKVSPAAITYIGYVHVAMDDKRFAIRVMDRHELAREYLATNYPRALAALPFRKELAELRVGG